MAGLAALGLGGQMDSKGFELLRSHTEGKARNCVSLSTLLYYADIFYFTIIMVKRKSENEIEITTYKDIVYALRLFCI